MIIPIPQFLEELTAIYCAETEKVSLPGFGLPLTSQPEFAHRFPTALQEAFYRHEYCSLGRQQELTPLNAYLQGGCSDRTGVMMEIMNRLTDKPNWNEKVFNEKIKWEVKSRPPSNAE